MASDFGDDELDGILDGALEEFDSPHHQVTPAPTKHEAASAAALRSPDEVRSADEPPAEVSVEAARAFENALKALGDLGLDQGEGDMNDADMKLVEEFMKTVGKTLGGFGGDGVGADAGTGGTLDGAGGVSGNGFEGKGGAADMEKMVESIVGHLLSEDVLKSPMLQMRAAYAQWLPKQEESLGTEELNRYRRQQELVEEICSKYESGAESGAIMELLSKMQETGSPPADVMKGLSVDSDNSDGGNVPPGAGAAELDKMMESCGTQ